MSKVTVQFYHGDVVELTSSLMYNKSDVRIVFSDKPIIEVERMISQIRSENSNNMCDTLPDKEECYVCQIPDEPSKLPQSIESAIKKYKHSSSDLYFDLTSATSAEAYRMSLLTLLMDAEVFVGYDDESDVITTGKLILTKPAYLDALSLATGKDFIASTDISDSGTSRKRTIDVLKKRGFLEGITLKCPSIGDRVWGTNNTGYTRCMNFEDRPVSSQNRIYSYLASSDPQNRRSYYEITDLGKFAEKINRRLGHLRYED